MINLPQRTIYDNLSKVGHSEAQEMFKQKVKELDPSIRFCDYNLQGGEKLTDIVDASQEAASALLQAQLDVRQPIDFFAYLQKSSTL